MNLLTTVESDSANCSLISAKDPLVLDNTASKALSCSWKPWNLLHSSEDSVFVPEDSVVVGGIFVAN